MNKELQKQPNGTPVVIQQHSVQSFSGPLPHPDILKRYNEIVPNSAERIIKMAEIQSNHRIEIENRVINSDISRSKWGQILGFIIALVGLVVSAVVAIYGSAIAGGIIGVGTLVSLVSVFMYGTKTQKNEEIKE